MKFFSQIKSNKDLKRVVENFFSLSILQVLTMFLPLITLPYILNTIGTSNYGIIILANSFLAYFLTFSDFSFTITATRDVAIHKHNFKALNHIYNKVFCTQVFIMFISAIVYFFVVFVYKQFRLESTVFAFTFINLIGKTLLPDWFFQGIEKMRFITIFNVCTRVVFVICIFIFIKEKEDYYLHPLFLGLGSLSSGIIAQFFLIYKYKLKLRFIGFSNIIKVMRSNFAIFINQFLPQLYNNSTTIILGLLTNNHMVGVYGSMKNITDMCTTLIRIISRVFFPLLNRKKEYFKKFALLIIGSGIGFCFLLIVFSSIIPKFLNIDDEMSTSLLIILSIGIPFLAMYQCYGTNYFLVHRQDQIVVRNTFYSSIIGFISSFPLIFWFGAIGAAINLTFCRGLMGFGLFYKYKKNK